MKLSEKILIINRRIILQGTLVTIYGHFRVRARVPIFLGKWGGGLVTMFISQQLIKAAGKEPIPDDGPPRFRSQLRPHGHQQHA